MDYTRSGSEWRISNTICLIPNQMNIQLLQSASENYPIRTFENILKSSLTAAFAIDFTTPGERLTRKHAMPNWVGLPIDNKAHVNADALFTSLDFRQAKTLNIAGNGIYTLIDKQWGNQSDINSYIFSVLQRVHQQYPLSTIRSGGQTGVDWAAGVAACALDIPCIMLFPKGFKQRNAAGKDHSNTEAELLDRLKFDIKELSI